MISGVEIVNDDLFFCDVLFRDRATIASVLEECVERSTTIITGCWCGYANLECSGIFILM